MGFSVCSVEPPNSVSYLLRVRFNLLCCVWFGFWYGIYIHFFRQPRHGQRIVLLYTPYRFPSHLANGHLHTSKEKNIPYEQEIVCMTQVDLVS